MNALLKAQSAWGENIPGWVVVLAEECDRTSQKKTSNLIAYSTSVVSNVLANKYPGVLEAVEQAVKGALLAETVNCPVYGDLKGHHCMEYQRKPFAATNPIRVRLYKACRNSCPHSRINNHQGGKA